MENAQTLGQCATSSWSPVIGDPTIWGWITVAIYALAALVAARVTQRAPFPDTSRGRESFFWGCLTFGLIVLAINKQLDLQSFITAVGRCAAQLQGWYEDRRMVQGLVILGLGLFVVAMLIACLILLRGTWRRSFWPLLGAAFVCGFVMIRAVGLSHVDRLIGAELPPAFGSVKVNFLLEAPGPLLIILSGLLLLRHRDWHRGWG